MTSKSQLTSIINQCCDILRTDDGITGAWQYTEALSWLLYLKFFDDKEKERKSQAKLEGDEYHPFLKKEYQWSVWTDVKNGKTGKELSKWINDDLIPYLSALKGAKEGDPRDIISAIFKNTQNRVNSGFLLKDVIEKIQQIHFDVGEEAFALSHIYEDLLRNMGEGGGNAGEYYTPRPLIKTMIQMVDPKIGETIYDPACGTGGFLAQAHLYLEPKAKTSETRKILNNKTFYGKEKTPLPYVLCLMNLTLHGLDYPRISKENTLQTDIRQIDERDKYDIILANPPFGGKEQAMIQKNFPVESGATELLFLQHIEKTLKAGGRAALVVPEGVLFQTNAAYQDVKRKLLTDCNLHTVVSLPAGVFLPYSAVKTSLIFFDKTKRTKDVWFYEVSLHEEKKLTKKAGITEKHFEELLKLAKKRPETEKSWLVPVSKILESGCNLSAGHYNPHGPEEVKLREPEEYALEIKELLAQAMKSVDELVAELQLK
ncbi:MAG: DNA methyltransferase [Bdellovibrionales bacterium RIFCSPHIGHO2_01_FULL_40_29]|nr:MAG: DNA methyltransferase [Bdellovibrionales bacterium RIFCSPHIGHO2_01_FULL_40_29]OFZ34830.1 MAG: DNA methyltransferase [Bdellovibrionales bacterium RIFCSPHIGHO2_02_FULL_40_15]